MTISRSKISFGHGLQTDKPVRVLEPAAGEQFQQFVSADQCAGFASRSWRDLGGPVSERRAGRAQRPGVGEIIAGKRGTGACRAGEENTAALPVGVGGRNRRWIVNHGSGQVARELDSGAQFGLACEGAPVEQVGGLEIGPVQRVFAPAGGGVVAGTHGIAIDAGHGLEPRRISGGGAGPVHDGAVARDAPGFGGGGAGIGGFRRSPRACKPGQSGDGGAGAIARPARPHGIGFRRLAGDLGLEPGLGVERSRHRLGALRRIA